MNPKKHITVQRMATLKHTEPPSLVSTRRKNTTRRTVTLSHEHSDRRIKLPPKRLDYVVSWWNSQGDYIDINAHKYTQKGFDLVKYARSANIKG